MRKLFLVIAAALLAACGGDSVHIRINRYEQLLFETPEEELPYVLARQRETYDSPLINLLPDDDEFMEMLLGFVDDETIRYIYRTTDSLYHDLSWLEKNLGDALPRLAGLCPEMKVNRVYTLLTADYDNYDRRAVCFQGDLVISIDHYALPAMKKYGHFGIPAYITALCSSDYLTADAVAAVVRSQIALPDVDEPTLLDYAILEGKTLWFLRRALPDTPDSILLRYTAAQTEWMENNVKNVWAFFIDGDLLYSSDPSRLRALVGEAPKTNAFGDGSAPRTPAYIGWQIVERYMKKTGATPTDFLDETDSRKILTTSGWRP